MLNLNDWLIASLAFSTEVANLYTQVQDSAVKKSET